MLPPLVRAAHYAGLWRALRSGASLVVHDCGTQAWVRGWLARRGAAAGPRPASAPARRHARGGAGRAARARAGASPVRLRPAPAAVVGCCVDVENGRPPAGCGSAVLLDRDGGWRTAPDRFRGTAPAAGAGYGRPLRRRPERGTMTAVRREACRQSISRPTRTGERARSIPQWTAAWPGNELEEVLAASLGSPGAGARLVEVLGRSHALGPAARPAAAPTAGARPAHARHRTAGRTSRSSAPRQQFLRCVGTHLSFTVAPAVEFARGLPPAARHRREPGRRGRCPAAAARRRRALPRRPHLAGRTRRRRPGPALRAGLAGGPGRLPRCCGRRVPGTGVVRTRPPGLAAIEGGGPVLFVGVEFAPGTVPDTRCPMDALGRALGRVEVPWPVNSSCWTRHRTRSPTGCWRRSGPSTSGTH